VGDSSAIGYTFARHLYLYFKSRGMETPVGMINAATGGAGNDEKSSQLDAKATNPVTEGYHGWVTCTGEPSLVVHNGPGVGYPTSSVKPSCVNGEKAYVQGTVKTAEGTLYAKLPGWGTYVDPSDGVKYGYADVRWLQKKSSDGGSGSTVADVTPAGAIQIAKAVVGFSYWWGGAAFPKGSTAGADRGSCTPKSGSDGCPDCVHSGIYGADCSGLIGKVWQLPNAMPMNANKHPYSTSTFQSKTDYWKKVSRDKLKMGDALVTDGHIVLFEKGDPWGAMTLYEARGCKYGIVHNTRSLTGTWTALRRDSF
ncbi:MAG: hypothetical protein HQK54_14435, partial [Oligoflexales bacterium]|nr:hypothetical protein [Oligoflexales bacterium]